MKKLKVIATLFCLLMVASLIAKDKSKKAGTLTPYTLPLPSFVRDYFDSIQLDPQNPLTEEGVALGRKLFYDKRLSANNTISCASCHKQQYAFADNKNFSMGVGDSIGIINAMPLFNLGWSRHFFWDGRAASLAEQAHDPVINRIEMANTWGNVLVKLQEDESYKKAFSQVFGGTAIDAGMVMKALSQFEMTLISFNTRFDKYYFEGQADALTQQEERGLDIFFGYGNCNHCHSDVLLTDNFFRNNGLDSVPVAGLYNTTGKEDDRGRLKVPSLRNIAVTAPYMHDGRFKTLNEVLDFYSKGIHQNSKNIDAHMLPFGRGLNLTDRQKEDLIAFLKVLTDSSFIHNKAFSNPDLKN